MKLTLQTTYAIRVLMYCASLDRKVTAKEISEFYSISPKFLGKIILSLSKAGYIETFRGRAGGFILRQSAGSILLGDFVRNVEDNFEMAECFKKKEINCPLIDSCGLRVALKKALEDFFMSLNNQSLGDLVDNRYRIKNLVQLSDSNSL